MIVKALECCTAKSYKCEECPYFYKSEGLKPSMDILMADAFTLIKELTEENESLRDYCDNFLNITNDLVASERKVARKYAIMKMQNRLKAICWGEIISPSTIDRIAEEILEE